MDGFRWGFLLGLALGVPATLSTVAAVIHLASQGAPLGESTQGLYQLLTVLAYVCAALTVFLFLRQWRFVRRTRHTLS